MNSQYAQEVISVYEQHRHTANATAMANYMKNKFEFLGIKSPLRKKISEPYLNRSVLPAASEALQIVDELWDVRWREMQYFALDLLRKYAKNPEEKWIDFYENLIIRKSWWDSVDGLAGWMVGDYFIKYPESVAPTITRWMSSNNIWLQRTCLIFQLSYKEKTDFDLMKSCIVPLSSSKEFFIQKGIGWALRQYYRVAPEAVVAFVNNHDLQKLSIREALKHHA